ncbi:unnamed protein product (macronuclear) [Paramecium tetraurelia]|uniref:RING-type domain-containing protein n=1 Tax=Paramecium tetraurelia TaxID=5888 RepID=A0BDA6_PARTE|nr:uncharacterized protein GSPATT00004617001 [Paramecium tetraurelia]CAK56523.1 unnamed protein product [Paramecium tetraurelia]|eukprot:XP_001423921.1 hypothetical protein (macronuclear) [Paramecium tetraurelia strain d4-2]
MICETTPNFTSLTEIYVDQNFQCICDWNAFEFTETSQKLMLIRDSEKNYNSYSTNTKFSKSVSLYVGIFSKYSDSINISINSKLQDDCLSLCKNNGYCIQHTCICLEGYFGYDCEYQGFDILIQDYLEKDKFYYLDVMKIGSSDFSLEFKNSGKVSHQCFMENPYLRKAEVEESASIKISAEEIMKCQLASTSSSKAQHYIIVQQYSVGFLYIQYYQKEEVDHFKTIIITVVSTGAICLCCFVICIFKCYRLRLEKTQQTNNANNIGNLSKNLKIFESSFDWTHLIPAVEYQSLLRKSPQIKDQIECQICLDSFKYEQFVRVTYCMHVYHYKCFDKWMKQNLICPICRSPQDRKSIDKIQVQENLANAAQSYSQSSNRNPEGHSQYIYQPRNKRYGDFPILTHNRTGGSSKLIQSN